MGCRDWPTGQALRGEYRGKKGVVLDNELVRLGPCLYAGVS
jgi:hypothetical protein